MTLVLELDPAQEAALRERAADAGSDEPAYAARLLSEALGTAAPALPARPLYETATAEEWVKAWREWTYNRSSKTPVLLDDSRAAIYED